MSLCIVQIIQSYISRIIEETSAKLLLFLVSSLPFCLQTHILLYPFLNKHAIPRMLFIFREGKRMNPTAFLFNNCSATKFYWYPFMFPLEDVMHKSIATEHIKLQMKFIVKSRMSSRLVSVFIFIHKTKTKKTAGIIYSFVHGCKLPSNVID